MIEIRKTETFAEWIDGLQDIRARILVRIESSAAGNPGDLKPVGEGMTQVARDAGLSRESLYKALSGERTPGFDTILKVVGALGLKRHAEAIHSNTQMAHRDRGKPHGSPPTPRSIRVRTARFG
jgi:hypothetical protein